MRRRAMLLLGAGAALNGCGFQPVYMRTASGNAGPAQRDLAAVEVAIIPDRPGQVLRQALQERLEGGSSGEQRRFDLRVSFWIAGEGLAVQPDTTSSRVRLIGNASWTLYAQDPAHTFLVNGGARAVDGLNEFDAQFFGADLETESVQRRIAGAVADQITAQLAIYFRKHANSA
jgi:LPS-assembly lipoprotein